MSFDPVVIALDDACVCGGFDTCLQHGMSCIAKGITLSPNFCTHCSLSLCESAESADFSLPSHLVTCDHCGKLVFLEDVAGVAANPLAPIVDSAWAQSLVSGGPVFSASSPGARSADLHVPCKNE